MKKELIAKLHKSFEDVAHEESGTKYWLARELQALLGYDEWRNFSNVVEKAKIACKNVGAAVNDHFVDVNKMILMPKGANKNIDDIMLTRYACYLIAQNGNPNKDEIAFAMTYFAVQTPNTNCTLTEKGKSKAVLMSAEKYESWAETLEVMQDFPDLEKDIKEAKEAFKNGAYKKWSTLEQLLAEHSTNVK